MLAHLGKEQDDSFSTVVRWYELEEFEAYRRLGYLMAWASLSNSEFSKLKIAPTTACRPL
jgi:hypothetical protein